MQAKIINSITFFFKSIYVWIFYKSFRQNNGTQLAYISYLTTPFFKSFDEIYLSGHQNRRETIVIGNIFEKLGIKYIVERPEKAFPKSNTYNLVFGLEPNFCNIAKKNPNALKIYYATGAYNEHQNWMIKTRTDEFNKKNNCSIKYHRLVSNHDAYNIADYIFQIGTKFTLESYPLKFRSKIITIDQSSEDFEDFDLGVKLKIINKTKFIWFGSNGSILKGLDLVLEYFNNHPEKELNIIGNIDKDFRKEVHSKLFKASNIHYHGHMYIHSPAFYKIIDECTFLIFPSGSEGCPGSVINLMKLGIIPIVSKWAAVDQINELGILIDEINLNSIEHAINKSQQYSNDQIISLSLKNSIYAKEKYNLNQFELQFKNALKMCINQFSISNKNLL